MLFLLAALSIPDKNVSLFGGTIIAMEKDNERIVIVADSRSHNNAGTAYRDDTCKVVTLGDKGFSFASGRTIFNDIHGNKLFDINNVAQGVFNDFRGLPNNENRLKTIAFYTAILSKSFYQDVAIQSPEKISGKLIAGKLIDGIIGGTLDDGSFLTYTINVNIQPNSTPTFPLITFTVERRDVADGKLIIIGSDEKSGVAEFILNQTERAKIANSHFESDLAKMKNPDFVVLKLQAAVQAAIDWADNKNMVGGPLDILELRRGGGC